MASWSKLRSFCLVNLLSRTLVGFARLPARIDGAHSLRLNQMLGVELAFQHFYVPPLACVPRSFCHLRIRLRLRPTFYLHSWKAFYVDFIRLFVLFCLPCPPCLFSPRLAHLTTVSFLFRCLFSSIIETRFVHVIDLIRIQYQFDTVLFSCMPCTTPIRNTMLQAKNLTKVKF